MNKKERLITLFPFLSRKSRFKLLEAESEWQANNNLRIPVPSFLIMMMNKIMKMFLSHFQKKETKNYKNYQKKHLDISQFEFIYNIYFTTIFND